jgi:hypothetical protein
MDDTRMIFPDVEYARDLSLTKRPPGRQPVHRRGRTIFAKDRRVNPAASQAPAFIGFGVFPARLPLLPDKHDAPHIGSPIAPVHFGLTSYEHIRRKVAAATMAAFVVHAVPRWRAQTGVVFGFVEYGGSERMHKRLLAEQGTWCWGKQLGIEPDV